MSDDTNSLGSPLRWYSVAIRFFAPSVATQAFIHFMTVPALSGDDAVVLARGIFTKNAFDFETVTYRMPDGTPIEMWHIHALEIPNPYAEELHKVLRANLAELNASATPPDVGGEDNVLPFPPHPKPDKPDPSKT